jgi:A/G-specific adenine glycosylase
MNFSSELIQWYLKNKRQLPWRGITDAYVIWLSEIILQQTRVEQGMPYFYRFLEKYPDVRSFASANEDEILKLWQGLGYYSRGRNMLKTAQQVVEIHGGHFPREYRQLIKLKGVGDYTAAAISSFSANEPKAVVDGNVYRVLARYFGIEEPVNTTKGKKMFQKIADEVLDRDHPGLHNQSIMEFGAILCKPKSPDCEICPIRGGCYAFGNNRISVLPQKLKTVKIRERFFNYLVVIDDGKMLMNKRGERDIWANMYDLPMIETAAYMPAQEVTELLQTREIFGDNITVTGVFPSKKHVLTHQHIYAQFIQIDRRPIKLEQKWFFIEVDKLKILAFPKIINIFIANFFN